MRSVSRCFSTRPAGKSSRHPLLSGIVPCLVSGLVIAGCTSGVRGNGEALEEKRTTGAFRSLELNGGYDLDFAAGNATEVSLSGDSNLLPLISTEVRGDRLVVESREQVRPKLPLRLTIRAPALDAVESNGAVDGVLRGLTGNNLSIATHGAGDLELSGTVGKLSIDIAGAGDVDASELIARDVTIDIAGAGDARVHATESLEVDIAGAGDVVYSGSPKRIDKSVVGAGEIRAAGE